MKNIYHDKMQVRRRKNFHTTFVEPRLQLVVVARLDLESRIAAGHVSLDAELVVLPDSEATRVNDEPRVSCYLWLRESAFELVSVK